MSPFPRRVYVYVHMYTARVLPWKSATFDPVALRRHPSADLPFRNLCKTIPRFLKNAESFYLNH